MEGKKLSLDLQQVICISSVIIVIIVFDLFHAKQMSEAVLSSTIYIQLNACTLRQH